MQKIDAHSHVGYFGGWADVGYTDEQMVAEMDRYGIGKSVVSYMDNTVVEQAVKRFPDRFVGITWANPVRRGQGRRNGRPRSPGARFSGD